MSFVNVLRKYLSILSFGLGASLFLVAYSRNDKLDMDLRYFFEGVRYIGLAYFLVSVLILSFLRIKKRKFILAPFISKALIFASLTFFIAISVGLFHRDEKMARTFTTASMKCWANVLIEECDIKNGCPESDNAMKLRLSSCPQPSRTCALQYIKSEDQMNFRLLAQCHMYGFMFLDRMGRTKDELNFTASKELRERVLTNLAELPTSF